jgi:hypothetical protein
MEDGDNKEERPAGQSENDSNSNHKVGYCNPPKAHQFKPGNNANPRGRKKGTRNRKFVIEEVLFEPIKVREGDKVKTMSTLEAILKKTKNLALGGDQKAAITIIGLAQKEGLLTPEQNETVEENCSDADKAIIADFTRRLAGS